MSLRIPGAGPGESVLQWTTGDGVAPVNVATLALLGCTFRRRTSSWWRSGLCGGVGELAADAVEGVRNGVLEGRDGGDCAETHEGRNQRVLVQLLTRIFRHQVLQKLLHVLHLSLLLVPVFRSTPALRVPGD